MEAGFTWKTIQEYGESKAPAAIISIRTQSVIPLEWSREISAILTRSTGYGHVRKYLKKTDNNLEAGYLPLYCNRSVAEQAMLLWMGLLRKLPKQMLQFSKFHRDGLTGMECENKNLLVVGVGNIGYEVVKIGKGLSMNVRGVDIVERHDDVDYVSIEEGIAKADIIVCSMNLTAENHDYFDYRLLKKAKAGVIFINVARGEMSPAMDLLKLLNEGRLGGLGMDTFNHESRLAVSLRSGSGCDDLEVRAILEMADRSDVIFTPHNAFNTVEAVERKAKDSLRQIESYLMTGKFIWPVDENK
ncbi:MAG: hydroxyacid dehydrogenase [Phycisphaerae bacterium]|nr:hydroxyacid dehydrogenase [Phycisphaerae bacterium]